MAEYAEIAALLQAGRAKAVREAVQAALDGGAPAGEILERGLLQGMAEIGEKFKRDEVFVPEVLIAARAMNAGMEALKPHLADDGVTARGTAVIGTVQGDLHDIGKNLVRMMLEGRGLTVVDLGVDVPAERFVDAAIEHQANLICCSSLLTTTMVQMRAVVEAAEARGLRGKVKIMVGGAPVTESFCRQIGADCYTPDAASAADAALALCS